ncbi:MAG TPA: hypothetical protein P5108_03590 [Marmoricola sp.]|nr:hypothetical protein [Nocardioidaceae bacterium]MCO5324092.1 hypothetical protein [Nocardioidaceae bacterium]HRV68510.1 hypothetical protein [Marmoricola sp.]
MVHIWQKGRDGHAWIVEGHAYFPPLDFFIVKLPLPLLTLVYPPKELLEPDF